MIDLNSLNQNVRLVDPQDFHVIEEDDLTDSEFIDLGDGLFLETSTNFIIDQNDEVIGRLVNVDGENSIQGLHPITVDDEIYYIHIPEDINGEVLVFDDMNQLADQETTREIRYAVHIERCANDELYRESVNCDDTILDTNPPPLEDSNKDEDFSSSSDKEEEKSSWIMPLVLLGLAGGGFYLYNRSRKK